MKRDFFRKAVVKDRVEQGRENPLFPDPKKPLWKKVMFRFGAVVFLCSLSYLTMRFTTQPFFYITEIHVAGITTLANDEVITKINTFLNKQRLFLYTNRHKWFYKDSALSAYLEKIFPLTVESITRVNQTISLVVLEDVLMSIVHVRDHWMLVDLNGKILRELTDQEQSDLDAKTPKDTETLPVSRLPKIEILPALDENFSNTILTPDFYAAVLTITDGVRALGLTPKRFIVHDTKEHWVELTLEEKEFSILFDTMKSLPDQLTMLKTVMNNHENMAEPISYIDLRFGNRIYIK